jgi:chromosome segregation ATPase
MPVSGAAVLQQLQQAEADALQQVEESRRVIAEGRRRFDETVKERLDAIDELARHTLPNLDAPSVAQAWSEAQQLAIQVRLRRDDHIRRLENQLRSLEEQREDLERQLLSATDSLSQKLVTRDELAVKLEQLLSVDPQFKALTAEAGQLQLRIDRGEANLKEIEADAREKLPAYENSSLFKYLHDRGFGTPQYEHRGFTRRMDRWVAKMIDYKRAKHGYEFLKTTPGRMGEKLGEWRVQLDTALKQIDELQQKKAAEIGLQAVQQAVTQIERSRDLLSVEVDRVADRVSESEQELGGVRDTTGKYYEEALKLLREFLAQQRAELLAARARQTQDPIDDQITARVAHEARELEDMQQEAAWAVQNVKQAEQIHRDLADLTRRFVGAGYHNPRSYFEDDFDVMGAIRSVAEGKQSASRVWMEMRRAQRMAPGWVEQTAETAQNVMTHPATWAILEAMGHVAGVALEEAARRSYRNRYHRMSDSRRSR